jgi:hydrogenase nickel incorporation protein HypA/HybF
MHESSLARQVLAAVLERAAEEQAVRVRVVRGFLAETEALSAESIAFHFAALAAGTIAEGAQLELDLRHVDARCTACSATYLPDHHLLLCPRCGSTAGELLGPTGLAIQTMDVEV